MDYSAGSAFILKSSVFLPTLSPMKLRNPLFSVVLLLIIAFGVELSNAQSLSDYRELQMRKDPARVYYDFHSTVTDSTLQLFIPFNIEHRFVNFRQNDTGVYETSVTVSVDLFASSKNEPSEELSENTPESWNLIESLTWTTEKIVEDFDETNSSDLFIQGFLQDKISAGRFQALFRITDRATGKELRGKRSTFTVPDIEKHVEFYLTEPTSNNSASSPSPKTPLINEGGNISYGEPVQLFMLLPKELSKKKAHLELEITRLSIDQRKNDTTEIGVQKRIPLSKADYFSSYSVSPDQEKDNSKIILSTNKNPTTDLWSVSLTSESWPTSHYRIALKNTQNDSVLHKRVIQSYWKNMPTPLLSLKFSVEMLEFIMDEKEFKKITKANRDKKLELFNEFWNPRDPTPETHKNELQAEYYRRVEVAMDEYTELSRPGFKTDRGEIYILYGEPKSITRNFPDQNVVIETWNYPNKTFRFRSSGGFDSFDLISQ